VGNSSSCLICAVLHLLIPQGALEDCWKIVGKLTAVICASGGFGLALQMLLSLSCCGTNYGGGETPSTHFRLKAREQLRRLFNPPIRPA
jgi:hypothetical protein